jgi:hypothetical protein
MERVQTFNEAPVTDNEYVCIITSNVKLSYQFLIVSIKNKMQFICRIPENTMALVLDRHWLNETQVS